MLIGCIQGIIARSCAGCQAFFADRMPAPRAFSALSLLVALVFGTDHHDFSVPLDDLALIAHGLHGRSDFHN